MALGWGIVGCGDVATKKVGPSFLHTEGASLLAAVSRRRSSAEAFATKFGVPTVYDSMDEMLQDKNIAVVYIATPPHLHYPLTIAAAAAGKHVLVEKPMALNPAQGNEMVSACRSNGVQLMVAHYRRLWPETAMMKKLIDDGALGEVVNARVQMTGNAAAEPAAVSAWKLNPELSGGGWLMDVGCHRIDLLLYLLGEVRDVNALIDSVRWEHPVDNSSTFLLRFKSGAHTMGSFHWNVNFYSDEFQIVGTQGQLLVARLGSGKIRLQVGKEIQEIATEAPVYTHSALLAHSIEALEKGTPHLTSGETGVEVSKVIEAAYRSSAERRTISISEIA
jgi:predicted dehydrogenase